MCKCDTNTCPKCDPEFEAYYQQKIVQAKEFVTQMDAAGYSNAHYQDVMQDAKDIWYEYCELKAISALEDDMDKDCPEDPAQWKY